jgi:hypothetical protein
VKRPNPETNDASRDTLHSLLRFTLRERRFTCLNMADNNALYAIRFPDGSLSLYIDEDYAIERGVDPATLTRVEIPRDMFVSGTIQEIREYVALYLESRHSGTA